MKRVLEILAIAVLFIALVTPAAFSQSVNETSEKEIQKKEAVKTPVRRTTRSDADKQATELRRAEGKKVAVPVHNTNRADRKYRSDQKSTSSKKSAAEMDSRNKALQEEQKTESLRNGKPVKPSAADRQLERKSTTRKENN